jgi:dTDP-4-amino-4,6-dideoxygalactose transaminase
MIPRYQPISDLEDLATIFSPQDGRSDLLVRQGLSLPDHTQLRAYASAREAFRAWLEELSQRTTARGILFSAQICPVLPKLAVRLGFVPYFVDVDEGAPTPTLAKLQGARTKSIAATIVSPMYGHAPTDVSVLAPGHGEILFDWAQGLLHLDAAALSNRVDANLWSFGIGKGLDAGGGLLASQSGPEKAHDARASGFVVAQTAWAKAVAFNAIAASGAWRFLAPRDSDGSVHEPVPHQARLIGPAIYGLWLSRLARYAQEIEIARQRARSLFDMPEVAAACAYAETFASSRPTHLRQVLRLRLPDRRDHVVNDLWRAGIDANHAGEPLPNQYLDTITFQVDAASDGLPNARRFVLDSIRLPFLGRLRQDQWMQLVERLTGVLRAQT